MANTELRIRELIREKGMTQVELAKKLGINPISLSQALARNNFELNRLADIADALGVEIPELFKAGTKGIELTCPHCGKVVKLVLQ